MEQLQTWHISKDLILKETAGIGQVTENGDAGVVSMPVCFSASVYTFSGTSALIFHELGVLWYL